MYFETKSQQNGDLIE